MNRDLKRFTSFILAMVISILAIFQGNGIYAQEYINSAKKVSVVDSEEVRKTKMEQKVETQIVENEETEMESEETKETEDLVKRTVKKDDLEILNNSESSKEETLKEISEEINIETIDKISDETSVEEIVKESNLDTIKEAQENVINVEKHLIAGVKKAIILKSNIITANTMQDLNFTISNNQGSGQVDYYSYETLSWNVNVDGTTITNNDVLENGYIDITVPNEFLESINALNSPSIKSQEVIRESDRTILRIFLAIPINSVTKFAFPINMTVKKRVTPNGYKVLPIITLHDQLGNNLVKANSQPKTEFKIIYDDPIAYKTLGASFKAEGEIWEYGGEFDPENKKFLTSDIKKLAPIPFTYLLNTVKDHDRVSYPNGIYTIREFETLKVVDTLPTYIDKNGNTITAHFDPSINPGWTLSKDGKKVQYIVEPDKEPKGETRVDLKLKNEVSLKLKFPGAPSSYVEENEVRKVLVNNEVEITPTYKNQSSSEISPVLKDDVQFFITGELLLGNGLFRKVSNSFRNFKYDNLQPYSSFDQYWLNIGNTTNFPIKNIVITEGGFDPRMYVQLVSESNISTSDVEGIYGILEDGTKEVIPFDRENNYFSPKIDNPTTDEIMKYAHQVESGKLDKKDVPIVPARYKKIELKMKSDFVLNPGKNLRIRFDMRLTDPYNVVITGDREKDLLRNYGSAEGDIVVDEHSQHNFKVNSNDFGVLVKKTEKIIPYKNTDNNFTGAIGETIYFNLGIQTYGLSRGRVFKNLVYFDLLPKGVTYEKTIVHPEAGQTGEYNDLIKSVETIDNYKDSGRTAIIVRYNEFRVDKFTDPVIRIRTKINENAAPTSLVGHEKINVNYAYLFEENNPDFIEFAEEHNITEDIWDVDNNPETKNVISANSTFFAKLPEELTSYKYIKRLRGHENNKDNEIYDENELDTLWIKTGINTNFEEYFEYQLKTFNNTNKIANKLFVYDKLNFYDGTKERNKLVGPIKVEGKGNFIIHYTTDEVLTDNPNNEISKLNWTETPEDFSKVTAFYIEMKDDTVLDANSSIAFNVPVKSPKFNSELEGKKAVNTSYVSYGLINQFGKANSVYNKLPETLKIVKTWESDIKFPVKISIYDNVLDRTLFSNIELNKENNFSTRLLLNDVLLGDSKLEDLRIVEANETDSELKHIEENKTYTFAVDYMIDGLNFTVNNKQTSIKQPWTPMIPPTRTIKVEKKWELLDEKEPVDKIEVELYKDGEATGEILELTKENNWKGEFKDLEVADKLGSTDHYIYSIKELGENENYIDLSGIKFKVSYSGNVEEGFIITNEKEKPKQEKPKKEENPKQEKPKKEEKPKQEKPKKEDKPKKEEKLKQEKPKKVEKPKRENPKKKENPNTGDVFSTSIYLISISLSTFGLAYIKLKSRKKSK